MSKISRGKCNFIKRTKCVFFYMYKINYSIISSSSVRYEKPFFILTVKENIGK